MAPGPRASFSPQASNGGLATAAPGQWAVARSTWTGAGSVPRPSAPWASGGYAAAVAASREEDAQRVAAEIRQLFESVAGSSLRAWLRYCDRNNDQKIRLSEFIRGMRKLGYQGDISVAFTLLDQDHSGELSLDEIDPSQASIWRRFRAWCVANFTSSTDMLKALIPPPAPDKPELSRQQFIQSLREAGWEGGFEELLFSSLDVDDLGALSEVHFKWLETEKRRQRRKDVAKRKAMQEGPKRIKDDRAASVVLAEFKREMRRMHGHCYLRAWRNVLSPDGNMVLQRNDIFKACAAVGWHGDVRLLWRALDKDDSGHASLEEFDAKSAEVLAHFREFMVIRFGSCVNGFRRLDKYNTKKLRLAEFLSSLKTLGFHRPAKMIFRGLDRTGEKVIREEDVRFLDKWVPPQWLTAVPDPSAAEELKESLLRKFKTYLHAWRHVLDVDSSNCCAWSEFKDACRKINWPGNVAGAWRALDDDLSGYITLREIDPASSDTLARFKIWADEEFGGVRSAFGVFDNDGSDEVTYREFGRACRVYGFEGSVHSLFHALDVDRKLSLSLADVAFLDEWDFTDKKDNHMFEESLEPALASLTQDAPQPELIGYETDGPGPGAYRNATTVGAGPITPMVQFSGAFSFRRVLPRLPQVPRGTADLPAPDAYNILPAHKAVAPAKPSWQFSTVERPMLKGDKLDTGPGPGMYSLPRQPGRSVMCMPRRTLKTHPLMGAC